MQCKYEPFEDFISKTPAPVTTLTLSFDQIELIIRSRLPKSARTYRQWWANLKHHEHSPQAKAWMVSGFKVDQVDLPSRVVQFTRAKGLFS
ncbi:MAG: hypothetical protein JXM72_11555 [Deltaproteobacteria bacterium]|nr:hypothetical protein [Deltaproteobacteria bacterium]